MTVDLQYLRQWVGRERIINDDMDVFRTVALASALEVTWTPATGDELPLCWQWLYFLDTPGRSQTGEDGHARTGDFLPPSPLPRRMWASSAMKRTRSLRLGQAARRHSKVRSIDAKTGKSGTLLFITLDHTISQDDHVCIQEEQNPVYRETPSVAAPAAAGEPAPGDATWSRVFQVDPVLLFRYSALTYNGHRIHFDRTYAMGKEFYPALVVHGPLLATLLIQLARDSLPSETLSEFQFRGVRPVFDLHAFTVCGRQDGKRLLLWIADHEGYLCISASAVLL